MIFNLQVQLFLCRK